MLKVLLFNCFTCWFVYDGLLTLQSMMWSLGHPPERREQGLTFRRNFSLTETNLWCPLSGIAWCPIVSCFRHVSSIQSVRMDVLGLARLWLVQSWSKMDENEMLLPNCTASSYTSHGWKWNGNVTDGSSSERCWGCIYDSKVRWSRNPVIADKKLLEVRISDQRQNS